VRLPPAPTDRGSRSVDIGSRSDFALAELRDRILAGRYPAGELLSEQALAEQLGISRTPIREALARLDEMGLVRLVRGRGAVIEGLTARELTELFELREAIETFAALRASIPADLITMNKLDGVFRYYKRRLALHEPNPPAWNILSAADEALHRVLVARTGNQLLLAQVDRLALRLVQIRSLSWASKDRLLVACDQHHEIIAASFAHDQEALADLLRAHLREGLAHLLALLAGPGSSHSTPGLQATSDFLRNWLTNPSLAPEDLPRLIAGLESEEGPPASQWETSPA
jgi:DNA-binding GntR family transcriptional regulator